MTKQEILDYLDNVLHPIVSPDNWNVYSELYDMVEELPSAEPQMTVTEYRERMIQAFHNADCDSLIAVVVLPTEKEFQHLEWLLKKEYVPFLERANGVDAVPVIRCKDCKYGERWAPDKCYCNGFLNVWVDEDDFCAWAEPKVKK